MAAIFISYRRRDSAGYAGRLADALMARYGEDAVFMDVDAIGAGADFVDRIEEALSTSGVVLVLVGQDWLEITDDAGRRRLDDPEDYVRLELETALRQGVPILPVLVDGAGMPNPRQLPEPLRRFSRLLAIELSDTRWRGDVGHLIEAVEELTPRIRPGRVTTSRAERIAGYLERRLGGSERARRTLLMAGGAMAAAVTLILGATAAARSLELATVDTRFSVRGSRPAPNDMVIVGIDPHTFDVLHASWPLDRRLHAQLIDRLRGARPRLIVYDVEFSRPRPHDDELRDAIRRTTPTTPVVLGTGTVGPRGETPILGGDRVLNEIGARPGFAGFLTEPGGVFRRVLYEGYGLKSIAVVAAEAYRGHAIQPSDLGGDAGWVDYIGPPRSVRTVSFGDVLRGRTAPATFTRKVVLVGATDPAIGDLHPTSANESRLMPGVEIHANAFDTVRRGSPLKSSAKAVDGLIVVAFALLFPLLALRWRGPRAFLLGLGVVCLYLVVAQLAFQGGVILSVTYPLIAAVLGALGVLAVRPLLRSPTPEDGR